MFLCNLQTGPCLVLHRSVACWTTDQTTCHIGHLCLGPVLYSALWQCCDFPSLRMWDRGKSVTDDCVSPMAQRSRRKTGGGELGIFLGHSFHAIITVILMVRHSLDCPEPFHSGSSYVMWFPLCEYDYAVWQATEGRTQGQVQANMEEVMHNKEEARPLVPPKKTPTLTVATVEQLRQHKRNTNVTRCGDVNLYLWSGIPEQESETYRWMFCLVLSSAVM